MSKKISQQKEKLKVEKRKIAGRNVKQLRKTGILPANIYGKKIKSLAVQVVYKDFLPVWQKVGETGIVELVIAGDKENRPVLIHNIQVDPVTDIPLHVDFHQVDLKEKITSVIPVEILGEAPAVGQKIGILIQPLDEVEVEALPADLPDRFTVDVSGLKEVNQAIMAKELKMPSGVKLITSSEQILVKINPLAKEEVVAPPPVTEAVPAEGETKPAEGEVKEVKPAEEAKPATEKPAVKPEAVKKPEVKPQK